jgi:hypothetical protein
MAAAPHCLHCGQVLDLADTNVATDVALCRACGRTMSFAAVLPADETATVDLAAPPRGVKVDHSLIHGIEIRYRRLNPVVFFLIPFTALWSGLSLWGIYGSQLSDGALDPTLALAGLPFVLGTLVLLAVIAWMLLGHWRVRLNRGTAEIFRGVGPFGRRQHLPLGRDTVIRLAPSSLRVNGRPQREIVMATGSHTVKFGALMPGDVRVFLAAVLRQAAAAA